MSVAIQVPLQQHRRSTSFATLMVTCGISCGIVTTDLPEQGNDKMLTNCDVQISDVVPDC